MCFFFLFFFFNFLPDSILRLHYVFKGQKRQASDIDQNQNQNANSNQNAQKKRMRTDNYNGNQNRSFNNNNNNNNGGNFGNRAGKVDLRIMLPSKVNKRLIDLRIVFFN